MALDTLIKKLFPVILGGLLAIIAYFQASGVVELIAAQVLGIDEQSLAAAGLRPRPRATARAGNVQKTAQPIIDNNLFDWETDLE